MLKIKYIMPVFVALLFLGLSSTAFAQLSCSVASTPVSRDTDTGLTEPAGDISFNCVETGSAGSTPATVTVDFGVPITNNTVFPTLKPISIGGVSGGCTDPLITVPAANVNNATGQVVIVVPAEDPAGANVCSFTLSGVLLGVSGTGKTSVQAAISVSPGNNIAITAGQNNATVVTAILPAFATGYPKLTTNTTAGTVLTNGTVVNGAFSVAVQENFIDMFKDAAQFNGGFNTNGVQLLYTFAGIPAGVTLGSTGTPCTATMTAAGAAATGVATIISANNTLTSANNTLTVAVGPSAVPNDPNLTAIDTVTVACSSFNIGTTATVPLTAGAVTATVSLAPTGTAFGALGVVLTGATTPAGTIPRYTSNPLPAPPLTVINIIPSTTHMLFPFVSVGNGFDTGFAIANTTNDPYGLTNGGARGQAGTVSLFFFPVTGNPFCVTTGGTAALPSGTACAVLASTTVGQGLSAGGNVASGVSWVVLGSEVFKQITGAPTVFNGYVFGIANFTNGHATSFVADAAFSGKFTAGGPALVLSNPSIIARTPGVATGVVEVLGH